MDEATLPELPKPTRCNPAEFCAARHADLFTADDLRAAVLAERERCARICERIYVEEEQMEPVCYGFANDCAASIREGV